MLGCCELARARVLDPDRRPLRFQQPYGGHSGRNRISGILHQSDAKVSLRLNPFSSRVLHQEHTAERRPIADALA